MDEMIVTNIKKINKAFQMGKRAIGKNSELDPELSDLSERADKCAEFYPNDQIKQLVEVEASDLRRLIIHHSQNPIGKRLFLKGVLIRGRLDLEGLSGNNGSPLPELHFVQCMFERGICFSGATIRHLSLKGSRFLVDWEAEDTDFGDTLHHICGINAKINGNLDLSHIRPLIDDMSRLHKSSHNDLTSILCERVKLSENTLTANLKNTYICGSLICSHSTFAEEHRIAMSKKPTIGNRTSFNICGVTIEKNLMLCIGFNVEGGLNAKTLHCKNEAWLAGCNISSKYRLTCPVDSIRYKEIEEVAALDLQSAQFDKLFCISLDGNIYSSEINGDIYFNSVKAVSVFMVDIALNNSSIYLPHLKCDSFYFTDKANDCSIEGSDHSLKLISKGSRIDDLYLNLNNVEYLDLDGIVSDKIMVFGEYSHVNLSNATIKSSCLLDGSKLKTSFNQAQRHDFINVDHLNLEGAVSHRLEICGKYGDINLNNTNITKDCILSCEAFKIDFNRSKIRGELDLRDWFPAMFSESRSERLDNNDLKNWPLLSLKQTSINGSINVGAYTPQHHVRTFTYMLRCYSNYQLVVYESSSYISGNSQSNVFIAYLENISDQGNNCAEDGNKFYRLDGTSNIFHRLNKMKELSCQSEVAAVEYLILFCAYAWSDEGPFRIVTYKQLRNNRGEFIDTENKERPNIPCKKTDGTIIFKKVIGKLKAYNSLTGEDGLLNGFEDFKLYLSKFVETSFLQEIEKLFFDKDGRLIINEDEFHYFIPATLIYDSEMYLGLFGLLYSEKDQPEGDKSLVSKPNDYESSNTHVQLLARFLICTISTVSVDKDDNDVRNSIIGDQNSKNSNDFGWADVLKFNGFVKRSGDKGALVKVSSDDNDKDLRIEDFFPEIKFGDDKDKTKIFTPSNAKEDPEIIFWKAWGGRTRNAFVNLSDASCELLDDGSGRGWGDKIILQTDRFRFKNLVRKDVESIDKIRAIGEHKRKASINKIMEEFYKPPIDLPDRVHKEGAITYNNPPNLTYYQQRLLWLCHYHHETLHLDQNAKSPDSGTFRRIARIYRSNGLTEAANYIDEARIRFDHNTYLTKFKSDDWSLDWNTKIIYFLIFLCSAVFSFKVGFHTWGILAGVAAIGSIFWNQITRYPAKYLVLFLGYLIDFSFRHGFRYGLSLLRPVMTIFIFIVVGWWGIQYLDEEGFMVLETTVVAQSVKEVEIPDKDKDKKRILENLEPHIYKVSNHTVPATRVGCGNTIDYGIYAVDIFIPLIELDQEERCMIRPFDESRGDTPYSKIFDNISFESTWPVIKSIWFCPVIKSNWSCSVIKSTWAIIIDHPTTWRVLQTIYILLGWIIISASLLTFSGYLQRQAESSSESEQKNR